jgi:hypothetical protein
MGKFNGLSIGGIIGGVVTLVVVFYALGATIPTLNNGLGNLTHVCNASGGACASTGIPFATLFSRNGIIVLALLGAVILAIVAYFGLTSSKR